MGKAQHPTNGALPLPPGRSILTDLEWETLKSALKLTRRQIQIAMGIMDDHTKQRIALDLRLSPHTVDMHTRMLYARLGVSSRVQLVMRLLMQHLAHIPT